MIEIQEKLTAGRDGPVWPLVMVISLVAGFAGCSRPTPESGESDRGVPEARQQATLSVRNAYMPAPVPGRQMGVIYLELNNPSRRDRELVLLETSVAEVAEVHRSVYEEGTMRMRKIQHLSVPAGQTIQFEPGGYHIMLMQLESVPEPPGNFGLQMVFDGGEAIDVAVQVRERN